MTNDDYSNDRLKPGMSEIEYYPAEAAEMLFKLFYVII